MQTLATHSILHANKHASQQHTASRHSILYLSVIWLLLQVWRCGDAGWQLESTLTGHTDWVRDAAWAPNLGLPLNTVASAGQDGQVGRSDIE